VSPLDVQLPDDRESLVAMVRSLLAEREGEKQRAQEQTRRADVLQRRADDLYLELLRAQLELERYKKWY
jgi:multidrug resistance efflux pump